MPVDSDGGAAPYASGIPLSARIVIFTAAAVLFGLGYVYLAQKGKRVEKVYQVLGSDTQETGRPAAFRVLLFDRGNHELSALIVRQARIVDSGGTAAQGKPLSTAPMIDATIEFEALELEPGEARLELEVEGWEGEVRRLEVPLALRSPSADYVPFFAFPELSEQLSEESFSRMDLTPLDGSVLGERTNDLWIRIADRRDRPISGSATLFIDEDEAGTFPIGPLGIARGNLVMSKPLHQLRLDVRAGGNASGEREEEVSPIGVMKTWFEEPIVKWSEARPPVMQVESETVESRLSCSLWRGDHLLRLFPINADGGRARQEIPLPGPGLYRVACNDHVTAGTGWLSSSYVAAVDSPKDFLDRLVSTLGEEPFFKAWPAAAAMDEQTFELASAYLMDHLSRPLLPYKQILNTLQGDVDGLEAEHDRIRILLLVTIGIVGLSLLLFTVAMALRHQRRLRTMSVDPELIDDMGDELVRNGMGRRKGLLLPAFFLLLAAVLNVASLIYILWLVLEGTVSH